MRRPGLEVKQGMKEIFGLHSPSGLVEHELIMDTVTFPTRKLSEVSHRNGVEPFTRFLGNPLAIKK